MYTLSKNSYGRIAVVAGHDNGAGVRLGWPSDNVTVDQLWVAFHHYFDPLTGEYGDSIGIVGSRHGHGVLAGQEPRDLPGARSAIKDSIILAPVGQRGLAVHLG